MPRQAESGQELASLGGDMAFSTKDYRSHLYENREHPDRFSASQKSSVTFSFWLFSAVPFLLLEYFFEVEFKRLPSGLMFPAGFLIFWGFYHTLLFSKNKTAVRPAVKAKPKLRAVPPAAHAEIPKKPAKEFLPEKVLQNLSVLGLKPTRDWNTIHKRYRELAKQYHPDLNPEVTTRGTRFMIYDSAYRNLLKFKEEYFK